LIEFYGLSKDASNAHMSFEELFKEWVDYKKGFLDAPNTKKRLSPSTIHRYETDYNNLIKGTELADKCVLDITSIDLERCLKDIIKNNKLLERRASNLVGYVSSVYDYATRKRLITTNEFIYVDKALVLSFSISKPKMNAEERVLNRTQRRALLSAIYKYEETHPGYLPNYAIELALLTGMRVGEIAVLRWSDIDENVIHIDHSEHRCVYDDKVVFTIGEPKSNKHREFPLSKPIKELLERIKAQGIRSEFIFADENGIRYQANAISCACRNRSFEAGLSRVSVHQIRRTVASELRKAGYSAAMVSNLLGHLERTEDEYYIYDTSEFAEKLEAANSLCSNVLNFPTNFRNKKIAGSQ
jgi:integrase